MKKNEREGKTKITTKKMVATNKSKLRQQRMAHIQKAQPDRVRFFERWKLRRRGRADGKQGLPQEGSNGRWLSPFMAEKIRTLAVQGDNEWTLLQNEHEALYIRMEDLMGSIRYHLSQYRMILDKIERYVSYMDVSRKTGEEALPESVIRDRRAAERTKAVAPMQEKCEEMRQMLDADEEELRLIVSCLKEDVNTMRMFLQGKKDAMLQRMDIYWNGAMDKHPDRSRMPAVPVVELVMEHEQTYMMLHDNHLSRAEKLLEELNDLQQKEAA